MAAGSLRWCRAHGRARTEGDGGEVDHDEEREPGLGLAGQVVVAVQDAHGDDVEGEQGADGDQVEQAVEGGEQRDDGCAADARKVRRD